MAIKDNFLNKFGKLIDQTISSKILSAQSIIPSDSSLKKKGNSIECETQIQLGIPYFEDEEYNTAFHHFKQALHANPKNSLCYLYLSKIYQEKGMILDARRILEKALQVCPNYKIFTETSKIYMNQNYTNKVIELWNLYITRTNEPENKLGYLQLGNFYCITNNIRNAVKNYEKFLSFSPGDNAVKEKLAELYCKENNLEGSLKYFEDLVNSTNGQQSSKYMVRSAEIYFQLEKYKECIDLLLRSLSIVSEFSVFSFLGDAYLEIKEFDLAYQNYHKAHTMDPNNFEICIRLAFICFIIGKVNERNTYFQNALKIKKNVVEISEFFETSGNFQQLKDKISTIVNNYTNISLKTIQNSIAYSAKQTDSFVSDNSSKQKEIAIGNKDNVLKQLQNMHNLIQNLILNTVDLLTRSSRTIYKKRQNTIKDLTRIVDSTENELKFKIHTIRGNSNNQDIGEEIFNFVDICSSASKKSSRIIQKDLENMKKEVSAAIKKIDTLSKCLIQIEQNIFILKHENSNDKNSTVAENIDHIMTQLQKLKEEKLDR